MKRAALILVAQLAHADGVATSRPTSRSIATADRACARGDAKACTRAGDLYVASFFSRTSHDDDGERALARYRRACVLEDVHGCTGIAWVLLEGMTAKRDYAAAMPILEKSCDAGDMAACTLIADQLEPGNGSAREAGVPADGARSVALNEQACAVATTNEGCTSGCNSLGSLYYYGSNGYKEDRVKAAAFYDKACKLGCINSCDTLGDMLRDGTGIPADAKRAAEVYEKACTTGPFAPSCMALSKLTADPKKAKQLFDRACRLSGNQVSGCPRD